MGPTREEVLGFVRERNHADGYEKILSGKGR